MKKILVAVLGCFCLHTTVLAEFPPGLIANAAKNGATESEVAFMLLSPKGRISRKVKETLLGLFGKDVEALKKMASTGGYQFASDQISGQLQEITDKLVDPALQAARDAGATDAINNFKNKVKNFQ